MLFIFICLFFTVYANTEKIFVSLESAKLFNKVSNTRAALTFPFTNVFPETILQNATTDSVFYPVFLEKSKRYEVRISYPAIRPAAFSLQHIITPDDSRHYIHVVAQLDGISIGFEREPVIYSIILDELFFNVIPYSSARVIIQVVIAFLLSILLFVPILKSVLDTNVKKQK